MTTRILGNTGIIFEEEFIMRKTIASVVVIFMCLFMFAGCRPKSIEEAIKPADLQKMVDELKENALFKNNYSDAKIEVSGNNVTYKYYYKLDLNEEQIAKVKDNLEKSNLKSQISSLKNTFKKSCGIAAETISFEYYTKSGTHIATISG